MRRYLMRRKKMSGGQAMKNNMILLLKTLLLSTSQRNIYKYTDDKKKKKRIVGGTIGVTVLYLLTMVYCIAMCIGYGKAGLIDSAPVMCALVISVLAFFFTLFKTNGYLFNFKEYDMLMSLPFETRTVGMQIYVHVCQKPAVVSQHFCCDDDRIRVFCPSVCHRLSCLDHTVARFAGDPDACRGIPGISHSQSQFGIQEDEYRSDSADICFYHYRFFDALYHSGHF